jgi:hypothetical protein
MIHRDKTHHRPRVTKAPGRSKWSYPWKATCECGFGAQEMTWHGAYIDALIHAETVR